MLNLIKKYNVDTIDWIVNIIALSSLFSIIISPLAFLPSDLATFRVPLFEFAPLSFGKQFDYIVLICLLGLNLIAPLTHKKYTTIGILCFLSVLILQDISRFESDWYQYYVILILSLIYYWGNKEHKHSFIVCFQIIFIGIYFWAGFNKLTVQFEQTYVWLMNIFDITKPLKEYTNIAYVFATFEMLLGIGLCSSNYKARRFVIIIIVLFHIQILVFLTTAQWGVSVWFWNIMMAISCVVLFWPKANSVKARIENSFFNKNTIAQTKTRLKQKALILIISFLFLIAPSGNIFGIWPNNFSFVMYANLEMSVYFFFEEGAANCLENKQELLGQIKDSVRGYKYFDIHRWLIGNKNFYLFPNHYFIKRLANNSDLLCKCTKDKGDAFLVIHNQNRWTKIASERIYNCKDL